MAHILARISLLISFIVISFFLLAVFTPPIHAAIGTPDLKVTLLSQSPDPVEPGDVVEVRFKIENKGAETPKDVEVELIVDKPFSLYTGTLSRDIGKLRGRQTGADAVIVDYKLKVDESAVGGETEIGLRLRIGDSGWQTYNDRFFIDVRTLDAILDIVSIHADERMEQGVPSTLRLTLKNTADSLLKDIAVTLGVEGTSFVPHGEIAEKRIFLLTAGEEQTLNFTLKPKPDASAGLFTLPVVIEYADELGKKYTIDKVVSLSVGAIPDLRVYVRESTLLQNGERGTITVEIANVGLTNVKFLQMTLLPNDQYRLLSPSSYIYIGDVDSDDTESEDFDLYASDDARSNLTIPLMLEYLDPNNNKYQNQVALSVPLLSGRELQRFGLARPGYLFPLIIIAALLCGLYWYLKKRKKRKEAP